MKFIRSAISFSDYIHQNKLITHIVISLCDLFFSTTRKIFKLAAYNSENLIILSLHRMGDTIFTIPAIREVQKHFKEKITIVCFSESIPIYKLAFQDVNFCVLAPGDLILNKRIVKFNFKKKLKALRPKIIIDLIGGMSTASLLFNNRAKKIFGTSKIQFRNIYDHFVEIREEPQLIDIYLDVISLIHKNPDRASIKKFVKSLNPKGKILIPWKPAPGPGDGPLCALDGKIRKRRPGRAAPLEVFSLDKVFVERGLPSHPSRCGTRSLTARCWTKVGHPTPQATRKASRVKS